MYFHIILTENCNSRCRYCYEKSLKEFDNGLQNKWEFDFDAPETFEVETAKLKKFISQDINPRIIFYGGEPLLQIEKIKEIMDNIHANFYMQTNGKLLNKLPKKYLKKFSKMLVSIDGNKERTDFNRGKGTFDLVVNNVKHIRERGFKGELVARMTIAQDCPDIFEQVKNILELKLFDSIHWQLDVGFYKNDFEEERIKNFFRDYNKSLSKLVEYWLNEIEKGNVIKIYPFVGIIKSLLTNEKTKLRCGAGYEGYAITTNGKIVACPIMNSIKNFEAGTLGDNPNNLKKFEIEECKNCEVRDLCGGRCLYWRKAKLWPKEGDEMICDSIKYYINEMKRIFTKIEQLIKEKKISEKDFNYERYFGPEIIP